MCHNTASAWWSGCLILHSIAYLRVCSRSDGLWDLGFCCVSVELVHVNVTPCLLSARKRSSGQFATAPRALKQPVLCFHHAQWWQMLLNCWGSPLPATRPVGHQMGTEWLPSVLPLVTYTCSHIRRNPSGIGREVARPWKRWQVNTGCCDFQICSTGPEARPYVEQLLDLPWTCGCAFRNLGHFSSMHMNKQPNAGASWKHWNTCLMCFAA